jgi:hypothetical protein
MKSTLRRAGIRLGLALLALALGRAAAFAQTLTLTRRIELRLFEGASTIWPSTSMADASLSQRWARTHWKW